MIYEDPPPRKMRVVVDTHQLLRNRVQDMHWLNEQGISLRDLVDYTFYAWVNVFDNLTNERQMFYTPKDAISDIILTDCYEHRGEFFEGMERPVDADDAQRIGTMQKVCTEMYWELQPMLNAMFGSDEIRSFTLTRWLGTSIVVDIQNFIKD